MRKLLLFVVCVLTSLPALAQTNAWINEFHYQNEGADVNEFIEIAVEDATFTTEPESLYVVLFDGTGSIYLGITLGNFTSGTTENGITLYSFDLATFFTEFNDGPGAIALCEDDGMGTLSLVESGGVTQFLSYEGIVVASPISYCAAGQLSTLIAADGSAVEENDESPANGSIGLSGNGTTYSNFAWTHFSPNSEGAPNFAQVLPVELVSFDAVASGSGVELAWETASETNNAGFEVEQRVGEGFRRVGFVAGHGTTTEAKRYAFRVAEVAPGRHVFRLKQVDYDGAFAYSPEVEVAVALPEGYRLTEAYPNPFNPSATFEVTVQARQHVTVQLFDVLGRPVRTLFDGVLEANTPRALRIEAGDLPNGTYVYRAQGETFSAVRTAVLLK